MNPWLSVWLLSVTGAGLFFFGGGLWMRLRTARSGTQAVSLIASELEATRAHMREQEDNKRKLSHRQRELSDELNRSQEELRTLNTELEHVRQESQRPLAQSHTELEHALRELTQLKRDFAEQARQLKRAEQVASASTSELRQLEARVSELNQRKAGETRAQALEQELALTRETLQARDLELDGLRESNARMRGFEEELAAARGDLLRLTEEMRVLRADAFAAARSLPTPLLELPRLTSRGGALQALVDRETSSGRAKSAVIADELGLLVAASGVIDDYGEALAALGAYIADIGSKTRDLLPLRSLRQVVVRDEHDLTLTVQPLAAEDPGLALVTLTVAPTSPEARLQERAN